MELASQDDLVATLQNLTEDERRVITGPIIETLTLEIEGILDSMLEPFRYGTLKANAESREIRLLELLPGKSIDVIRCRISVASLERNLNQYDALSYVWGDESSSERLIIVEDGHGGERKFAVKENLFFALKRLRLSSAARTLWVDAACINQKDDQEKNVQVGMMRDIYAGARKTFIWLGRASDASDAAFALIPKLVHAADIDDPRHVQNLWAVDDQGRALPEAHMQIWYYLLAVLGRPWFNRVWVVQELAVSRHPVVLCGDVELEWRSLVSAIHYTANAEGFEFALSLVGPNRLWTLDEQRNRQQERQSVDVMKVLIANRGRHATKPVDHIFAFHGFFEEGTFGHTLTRPRYEVNCKQLYTEVAIELLKERQNLDIFSIVQIDETCPEQRVHGLPTWVPDWSAGGRAEALLWRHINPEFTPLLRAAYEASGNTFYCPVVQEGRKLRLRGWMVDEVNATGMAMTPTADKLPLDDMPSFLDGLIRYQRTLRNWEAVSGMFKWRATYLTDEKPCNVYCQTLFGGRLYGYDYHQIARIFSFWQKTLLPFRLLFLFRLDQVWFLTVVHVLTVIFFWCFDGIFHLRFLRKYLEFNSLFDRLTTSTLNRRMIRSDNGLIGIAPPLTQPADVIALCEGGKLPLILRPRGSDWELIGDCYVHGLTDGKLWNMLEGNCEAIGPLWEAYNGKCERRTFWLV